MTTGRTRGRLWVAKGGGGGRFFGGIVCAEILETLNSFNIDVLGYIKGLSLNAMIICMGTQEVVCMVINNRVVARVLHTLNTTFC